MAETKKLDKKQAELIFLNGSGNSFTGYRCSECSQVIAIPENDISDEERQKIVDARFAKHLAEAHPTRPREDFSQTAVRIVREATKD